ncbi:hypothetical protein AB0G79_15465 [Streptomyces sp. NPDC020807]|uniref:RCC1 domain-containing protein n=1 Tax=Streptomyces sp. NPDC020807 TaxID=3155119 RepID=UPI003410B1E5
MSVPDSPPGARRRAAPRRPRAVMAALVTALATATALVLPGFGLSGPSPAHADGAGGLDIRPGVAGTVLTWGSNYRGQLGDGNTAGSAAVPGRVCGNAVCTVPQGNVVQVAAGDGHSIALLADGTVLSWGNNESGQLGDGTSTSRTTPVRVCAVDEPAPCASFLKGVVSVAVGDLHSLALLSDGTVVSWGSALVGRLGNGTDAGSQPSPGRVCEPFAIAPCTAYLSNVTALGAGYQHTLALRADGSVVSWGYNGNGQLGDGTTMPRPVPVNVLGLYGATSVAAGTFHSVAATSDGSAYGWGVGPAVGHGSNAQTALPALVCDVGLTAPCSAELTGVKSVAAGSDHTLAARTDGTVLAWGNNSAGRLGDGTLTPRPAPVRVCAPGGCSGFLTGVTAVAAGISGGHSVALREDGSVRAWGFNDDGQLGDGTKEFRKTPVRVCAPGSVAPCTRFLEGVTSIAAGDRHTIAVSRPLADLATSVSATPEPVANGGTLTYTVRVHNYGPTAAADVVLTDHLPTTVRYVSASPSVGNCDTPPTGTTDTVTCSFGSLPRGGAATVKIAVKVRTAESVTHVVSATSETPDPRPANNTAAITTPVG